MDINAFVEKINRYMAERERLNVQAVYAQFKDQYPVELIKCFENGTELEILRGESSIGKFELYDNRLDIVFDVDKADGGYLHWHPHDTAEAIEDVRDFLQGKCKYFSV